MTVLLRRRLERHANVVLLAAAMVMISCSRRPAISDQATRCRANRPPIELRAEGDAYLLYWKLNGALLSDTHLPTAPSFVAFQRRVNAARVDARQPPLGRPRRVSSAQRAIWDAEQVNYDLTYTDGVGNLRPLRCLDALLFSLQNAKYSQLDRPTEFVASILRHPAHDELRVYLAGSGQPFPPTELYGLDFVSDAIADGWEYLSILHNHTVRQVNGRLELGVPMLSSSDVDLVRSLKETHGLRNAWVTNGIYTLEVPSVAFGRYRGREVPRSSKAPHTPPPEPRGISE